MADRVVKVNLSAQVSSYLAGMEQAAKKTREVSTEAQKLAEKSQAFEQVGRAAFAVGAVAAAGFGLAVARFAEFDQAMSSVKAATQETTSNMSALRDAALDAGGETVYTATEAANAIEEMGKAGVSTADILGGGLDGALALAAAGQLSVARAGEVAAISMKQFGLAGSDIPHIADLLAAGAGKAAGDVEDLSQALNQSALVANQTGLSIEETTGTLAAFASAGLLGSDAGTSLRTMLQRLTPQSAEAKKEMDRLGISAYDAQGSFIGMEKFAGVLETSLGGLTDEQRNASLAVIFGADAVRGASVLYSQGAKGVAEWVDNVNDSGYAAKVAADRLDNLAGDVEKLGGAFDTGLIQSGSTVNDVLRGIVQSATFLVDGLADLPAPVLGAGMALTGLTAVVGLAGGVAMIAVPKFAEMKIAMETLGITAGGTALKVGLIGGAVALATVGIGIWVSEQAKAKAATDALATTLDKQTAAITRGTREMIKENLAAKQSWWFIEGQSTFDAAEKLGISLDLVTDAATGNVDALKKLDKEMTYGTAGSKEMQEVMDRTGMSMTDVANAANAVSYGVAGETRSLADAIKTAEQKNKVTDEGVGITGEAADAYMEAADQAASLNDKLLSLIGTINESNGMGRDAVSTNAAYQESLAGIRDYIGQAQAGVEGFALGMDQSTVAGSANADMLAQFAAKAEEASVAQLALDGDVEAYMARALESNRITAESAAALESGAEEAQTFADRVAGIPTTAQVKVTVETAEAQRRLDAINSSLAAFRSANVNLNTYVNRIPGAADGGTVAGVGTSKSDSNLYRLSVGEEVIQEPYASRHRALLKQINSGGYQGFAYGGTAGYAPASYASSSGMGGGHFNVVLSQKGGVDILRYVDVAIERADQSAALSMRMG